MNDRMPHDFDLSRRDAALDCHRRNAALEQQAHQLRGIHSGAEGEGRRRDGRRAACRDAFSRADVVAAQLRRDGVLRFSARLFSSGIDRARQPIQFRSRFTV
jgi:hypothetical protein